MQAKIIFLKIKRKLWYNVVSRTRSTFIYPYIYRSYWHSFMFIRKRDLNYKTNSYFTARPNPGAGIGHQMANWIAGYWFAKEFQLKFAHSTFSNPKLDDFLGFGDNEFKVSDLINQGYRKVLLPLFNENCENEIKRTKSIIASYGNKKVVFICEQDQFYKNQFGVIDEIKHKFYNSMARQKDEILYSNCNFNIAIHVRRGDIVKGQENKNPNLLMRWQKNDYFSNVLSNVLKTNITDKPIAIYLFSQGIESDFEDFKHFQNLHFCLDMDARDSFLHMVYADLLITSKSSFSYKPALLNNGIKVCPKDFWHGYPNSKDWILADVDGRLDGSKL